MLGEHLTAVKTRLQAHTLLTDKVDDVIRIRDTGAHVRDNYVVLAVTLPAYVHGRLTAVTGPAGDLALEVRTRIVATSINGLILLVDAVNEQLQGHVLVVPGRTLVALNRDELEDPAWDRAARLYSCDAWYTATSSRA